MAPLATLGVLDRHGLARLGAQVGVGLVAHRDLVLLGDAEQHADDPHRHLRAEVGDEVEAAGADERVEAAGAERRGPGPRARPCGCGVNTRDSRPRCTVCTGGSSNMMTPGGQLDVGLDELEDVAAGAGEGLPVDAAAFSTSACRVSAQKS